MRNRSQLEINEIITIYTTGQMNLDQICKTFHIALKTINKIFKEYNVDKYLRRPKRKYYIDTNFLEKIDTQEKAWFLGFLYADGCNQRTYISLELAEQDFEIFEKIKNILNTNTPVKISPPNKASYQKQNMCRMNLYCKKLALDAIKQGVIPSKSLVLTFPTEEQVPEHLIRHFIRGYLDGDGNIYHSIRKSGKTKGRYSCSVSMMSTVEFVKSLCDICNSLFNVGVTRKRPENKQSNFICTGFKSCKLFLDWLYTDSTIHLNRKYQKYMEIVQLVSTVPSLLAASKQTRVYTSRNKNP